MYFDAGFESMYVDVGVDVESMFVDVGVDFAFSQMMQAQMKDDSQMMQTQMMQFATNFDVGCGRDGPRSHALVVVFQYRT